MQGVLGEPVPDVVVAVAAVVVEVVVVTAVAWEWELERESVVDTFLARTGFGLDSLVGVAVVVGDGVEVE